MCSKIVCRNGFYFIRSFLIISSIISIKTIVVSLNLMFKFENYFVNIHLKTLDDNGDIHLRLPLQNREYTRGSAA